MNVHKIITNRNKTIYLMEENIWNNISEKLHYKNLFIEKNNKDKRDLLGRYIQLINDGDIFDLAISIRKIGIVKFYEMMKEELEKADIKNQYLSGCDIEEQNKYIEEEKNNVKEKRRIFEREQEIQSKYPAEIIILFKKIFNTGIIKSQEDIIDYKIDNKVKYIFNRKGYLLHKNILKYYEVYKEYNLLTDGEDLFNEYNTFLNFEKNVESKILDIQRIKSSIQAAEDEIRIYNEDLKAMKEEYNLDAIKRTTIRKFIKYSIKEKMVDYYLELFENAMEDRDLIKLKIVSDLRLKFYLEYNSRFEASNEYLKNTLNDIKNDLKKVVFASFENTNLPIFSNVGYFYSDILNRIDREKNIINILSKKDFIDSYEFSEIEDHVILEMKKKNYKEGLYIDQKCSFDFKTEELEKYYQENEAFIKYFK